jgi:hypothetical protein
VDFHHIPLAGLPAHSPVVPYLPDLIRCRGQPV